jgi:hypothetical protein
VNTPGHTSEHEIHGTGVQDKYDGLMQLASSFDAIGDEMRQRAGLGAEVLADDGVSESEELSAKTYSEAENDILSATSGRGGLLDRSIELDVDALAIRATVMTYRWIDELQVVAERTLGSVAGRAVGYLAPEVALGGAIVSAGLIETDALDRDGLAAYLNELAVNNPDLMEHFTSGGGGLLDRLQMRALLTVAVLGGPEGRPAANAGLRAIGVDAFAADATDALRDLAGSYTDDATHTATSTSEQSAAPSNLEALMAELSSSEGLRVQQVTDDRYIAYLPGQPARRGELRLVGSDRSADVAAAVAAIEACVPDGAHVMLVGSARGGMTATEIAAASDSGRFTVDQVVTVASPSSQVARIPDSARVLSLEDRADPVALLGSLINASVENRFTVVYDGGSANGKAAYVAGGRAADGATNQDLRAEINRIRSLGYLAG